MKVTTGRSGNKLYHTNRECPSWPENPTEHDKEALPHHRQCVYCERLENGEKLTDGPGEIEQPGVDVSIWLE